MLGSLQMGPPWPLYAGCPTTETADGCCSLSGDVPATWSSEPLNALECDPDRSSPELNVRDELRPESERWSTGSVYGTIVTIVVPPPLAWTLNVEEDNEDNDEVDDDEDEDECCCCCCCCSDCWSLDGNGTVVGLGKLTGTLLSPAVPSATAATADV